MVVGIPLIGYQSCNLYGATSYTNSFLPVNFLVILASFSIVTMVYVISKVLPPRTGGRIIAVTRAEMVELVISAVILMLVLAFSVTACSISSSISSSITKGSAQSPITTSELYIGGLTFDTGLTLLTNIYSYSISFSITSVFYNDLASPAFEKLNKYINDNYPIKLGFLQVEFPLGFDLGKMYGIISTLLLAFFAPLLITALAMLFVQWLALPVIQATAFVIVLPVALAMRSFAYAAAGPGLRSAANTVLAIAIAAYIIYPLAVSFDPCIMSWLYGHQSCISMGGSSPGSNPLSQYLSPYTVSSLPPGLFSSTQSSSYQTSFGPLPVPAIGTLISTAVSLGFPGLDPFVVLDDMQMLIDDTAQFIFVGVVLFAIDVGITVAFAMGLTRALNSGIEGQARFWSS